MDQKPQSKIRKPGKPRIPDHLRKRALVSCDRCKQRRIRCLRSSGVNGSSSDKDQCQGCIEAAVPCKSTLPRKTRIYGSVESLSHRYRVLETVVKGLFPDKDTSNIDVLYEIADSQDISLSEIISQNGGEEVFNSANPPKESSTDFSAGTPTTPTVSVKSEQEGKAGKPPQERLVPTPTGLAHYIGPSSSFGFTLTVRNLMSEFNVAVKARQSAERAKLSSEFASSNWSKALEPKVSEERRTAPNPEDLLHRGSGGEKAQRHSLQSLHSRDVEYAAIKEQQRKPLSTFLPDKSTSDTLVDVYFDRIHPNYLVFHRPTFQAQYQRVWERCNSPMQDHEPGWICCLFMIFVFGLQILETTDRPQCERTRNDYPDLVKSRVYQLLSSSSMDNLQALLLLQLYQHNNSERNTAFMILGCASRMAMALGMHREATNASFDPLEREMRRRVWWTLYLFEQNQCTILGRPAIIDEVDINASFPNEMVLDGCECVPAGYTEYLARLVKIISKIRRKIYYKPAQQGESARISQAIQLMLDLESWTHTLPHALRLDAVPNSPAKHARAILLLHIQLHNTQAFLARPFKLRKVSVQMAKTLGKHVRSQDLDDDESALSDAAGTFCRKGIMLLYELIQAGMFDGLTCMDGYYIYHQVFILAVDFLGRDPASKDSAEDISHKRAVRDVMGSLHNLRLCPSFSVLTQVAFQISKIVGIFDDPSDENLPSKLQEFQHNQYSTLSMPIPTSHPQPLPPTPAPLSATPFTPLTTTPTPALPLSGSGSPYSPSASEIQIQGLDMINTFFEKEPLGPPLAGDFNYFGDAYTAGSSLPAFTTVLPSGLGAHWEGNVGHYHGLPGLGNLGDAVVGGQQSVSPFNGFQGWAGGNGTETGYQLGVGGRDQRVGR